LVSGSSYSAVDGELYYIQKVGDGLNPTGYNRLADYIASALQKTGLNLNLRAVFNIRDYTSQSFTTSAKFLAGSNIISLPVYYNFFYVGEKFTVTGTASNNGTFT